MKAKRIFSVVFIALLLLSVKSIQAHAHNLVCDGVAVIRENRDRIESESATSDKVFPSIVIFTEHGEQIVNFVMDIPNVTEKDIGLTANMFINEFENREDNYRGEFHNTLLKDKDLRVVTCCERPKWKTYRLEIHSKTSPVCYVDVYDYINCRNCGAYYTQYKESYSHLREYCPF